MADRWMIIGNLVDGTSGVRAGAKVVLKQFAVPRCLVSATSQGGRKIEFWVDMKSITRCRTKWAPPEMTYVRTFADKAEAERIASNIMKSG